MNNIYPWQFEIWQRLYKSRQSLPHALLLRGINGIGKLDFALTLAQALLCETPTSDGFACNACSSCGWFRQNNHPDYRLFCPEPETATDGVEEITSVSAKSAKKSKVIKIDQIRELSSFIELSSHRSTGLRVALIHPAESITAQAANALLKMLEEPPGDVIFILVSHQPQLLLPTIMSRCQKIDMSSPDTEVALHWLNAQGIDKASQYLSYAGGSPLAARDDVATSGQSSDLWLMLERGAKLDIFVTISLCLAQGMERAIVTLQKWIYDLIGCRLTGEIRYHIVHASALQGLSKSVDLNLLFVYQRKLDEARKSAHHPLNNELQLECILLLYTQLFVTTI